MPLVAVLLRLVGGLGVDTDGGTPDGEFTKEGAGRVAARRCPYRLFAAMAGAVSNLICEADDELRPLCQVLAPNVMIMKGLRNARKPRQRVWAGSCALREAPVEYSGHVPGGLKVASGGGRVQVEERMLTGFSRQREQVCSERRPRRLSLAVEHLNDLRSNQLLGRDMEPVCVAPYGVGQPGRSVGAAMWWQSRCVVASECLSEQLGRGARRDAVGSDEGVWVAVADDLQVEVVGGPAAGEHGVELLARLLVGEQAVHGVGDDALGGVDGGGVAETGRGSDVVGVRSDRVVVAGVPDSQLGVKARPVGRPRSGAALTPIPAGASFGWRAARSGCRMPHILLGN
jgi:hypothetical protein